MNEIVARRATRGAPPPRRALSIQMYALSQTTSDEGSHKGYRIVFYTNVRSRQDDA